MAALWGGMRFFCSGKKKGEKGATKIPQERVRFLQRERGKLRRHLQKKSNVGEDPMNRKLAWKKGD